jgi:hypothetical protein
MNDDENGAWLVLWNVGILVGLVGLPAELGFFAGRAIEASHEAAHTSIPWGLVFAALGVLVGALAAWRTLAPATRRQK